MLSTKYFLWWFINVWCLSAVFPKLTSVTADKSPDRALSLLSLVPPIPHHFHQYSATWWVRELWSRYSLCLISLEVRTTSVRTSASYSTHSRWRSWPRSSSSSNVLFWLIKTNFYTSVFIIDEIELSCETEDWNWGFN